MRMRLGEVGLARLSLVAPPLLLVVGWTFLIANAGQGADDAWAAGHLILFAGNALWIPAVLTLTHVTGPMSRRPAAIALGLAIVGSVCVAGQLAVDLVAWSLSLDAMGLRELFTAVRARPVLVLLFYLVGPSLLVAGIFTAALALNSSPRGARTGGRLVAAGLVIALVGALSTFSLLTLAGYVAVLVGFAQIAAAIDRRDVGVVVGEPAD